MRWGLSVVGNLALGLILISAFADQVLADGGGNSEEFKREVNGYEVFLVFANGEAQKGRNELTIELHDPQGLPVKNAVVTLSTEMNMENSSGADMDMGGKTDTGSMDTVDTGMTDMDMMGMDMGGQTSANQNISIVTYARPEGATLRAGDKTGQYIGGVEFDDAGQWTITVNFVTQGQEGSVSFVIDITEGKKHGPNNWLVLFGFLGLNIAVIAAAAITKRKRTKGTLREGTA
ncbi:MAG: hypothetical protein WC749_12640 [Dehalococcoidia bacterium]